MITDLFLAVFEISIAAGGIAAVCMLLLPLLNRRYAAKWSYYIWIFLALRLLLPVNGEMALESAGRVRKAFSQEQEAQQNTAPAAAPRQRVVIEIPPEMTAPIVSPGKERAAFTALDLAASVWLFGCVVALLFPVCSYLGYRRRMLRETVPLEEGAFFVQPGDVFGQGVNGDACGEVPAARAGAPCEGRFDLAVYGEHMLLAQLQALSKELHIRQLPPVRVYDGSISPMIMGVIRPVLVLPKKPYCEEELYFVLKHELIHLKRHDVAVKLLFVAANALHWFNPLIYLMKRRAVVDMELSCDERVIRGIAYADRKAYTETLFSAIQAAYGKRTYLSTQFYGGKEIMKKRFKNIFTRVRKKNGMPVLSCAVLLTLTLGMVVSCGVNEAGAGGNFKPTMMRTGGDESQAGNEDGMSDEKLCELAKQYFAVRHAGKVPEFAEIDGTTDEGLVQIHLYDMDDPKDGDGGVTMTLDWYTVDRKTGIGEDLNFEPVNLLETAAQADAPAGEEQLYGQMAGSWMIDFDRTENLWGSGISYGNEMKIAAEGSGSFSYYIGVGVGGTGQCEANGDALQVEVEPYEDNTDGKEILTLRYVNEDNGEWILMDWHDEKVYWKRAVKSPEAETTLTFVKEGMEERKQAELTYGDGFALYLPVGEWQASAPDQWTSRLNERVQIWAAHFEGSSEEEAWKELKKNGYSFENGEMLQENGTLRLKIKLFVIADDVWGVFYRYPAETEEGFGQELSVIADTFMKVDQAGGEKPAQGEASESEELYRVMEAFADAYFGGDADGLRKYLADGFEGQIETYEGPGSVERLATRGLGTDESLPVGSTRDLSLEFQDSTEDSYTYLSAGLVKQENGWKVQWYGLEK